MSGLTETNKEIYRSALSNASEYQPWKGYYLTRLVELEIIFDLLELKEDFTILEIGCGNGFYSALLSSYVKKIYCGDLEIPNGDTHTMGIYKARELINELNITNVNISSFSGRDLPFKDETFNLVFTSSTLEHIPDRKNAVSEIKRVLKPGGKAVIIVPNFITSIYSIIHLPLYLCMAILRRLFKKRISKGLPNGVFKKQERMNVFTMLGNVLIPKPHGEYKNIFDELQNTYPAKWERLLSEGGMKVLSSRGTIILPWSLISVFSSHFGALLYGLTKGFHKTIVIKYDFFKYFSYLICIVARK